MLEFLGVFFVIGSVDLLSKNKRSGFVLGVISCIIWFIEASYAGMHGLQLLQVVLLIINVKGFVNFHKIRAIALDKSQDIEYNNGISRPHL